jgi:hypothetical protein
VLFLSDEKLGARIDGTTWRTYFMVSMASFGAMVAALNVGALVNAHLTADLTSRLKVLQLPSNFISIVINAIENGTVPGWVQGGSSIEDHVTEAAYGAFRSGLAEALITAGIAMLVAAFISATTLGRRSTDSSFSLEPGHDRNPT